MHKPITFAKVMTTATLASFAATVILALLYFVHRQSWLLSAQNTASAPPFIILPCGCWWALSFPVS